MVNYFLLVKTRREKSKQPLEGEAASKCCRRGDHGDFYSAPEAATSDWVSVIPPSSSSRASPPTRGCSSYPQAGKLLQQVRPLSGCSDQIPFVFERGKVVCPLQVCHYELHRFGKEKDINKALAVWWNIVTGFP